MDDLSPAEHWEKRYAESDRVWSGRVNPTRVARGGPGPGRALDLGCGEGGDVLWLAQRGWRATGIDISATAVARAEAHAEEAGLPQGQAEFVAAELPQGIPDEPFDLITASFLQSTVELDRQGILEAAAARVAPAAAC
ncbi:methyltransferase domain-containing protein [Nesterenkonia pannonica]|uniref:class I SAM-dependent methyltransferase n=1 Tax=Nesterenkonia pannonica TaxID=1548602 RepID=UPI002164C366|nr:class I SAM-dependent methyltransferase [Nesterenkonia pannonica]